MRRGEPRAQKPHNARVVSHARGWHMARTAVERLASPEALPGGEGNDARHCDDPRDVHAVEGSGHGVNHGEHDSQRDPIPVLGNPAGPLGGAAAAVLDYDTV